LEEPDGSSKGQRKNWARLIRKIYEVDLLICPKCQIRMQIITFIEDEEVTRKIPKHLGLWDVKARPPPRANSPQFPYARPHQERLFIQKSGTALDKREEG
jgi:hypothetical protein